MLLQYVQQSATVPSIKYSQTVKPATQYRPLEDQSQSKTNSSKFVYFIILKILLMTTWICEISVLMFITNSALWATTNLFGRNTASWPNLTVVCTYSNGGFFWRTNYSSLFFLVPKDITPERLLECSAVLTEMSTTECHRIENYTLKSCRTDPLACKNVAQQVQLLVLCLVL
jgi:hypothetical protein